MSGFFNSYYYGKAGQADFTPDKLPSNRFQLFFDALRYRIGGLIGMNLIFVVSLLPAIIWTVMNYTLLTNLMIDPATGAELTVEAGQITAYINVYLMGLAPCLMIVGIVLPGVMYVLRNWARNQHSFVMSDFKDAVKGNWKKGLVVGLINGLSLPVTFICYMFYSEMAAANVFWVIPQMFVVVLCIVWWMAGMQIYPMMVTYDMKLGQLIRNSLIITIARLPWSVLFWALPIAVPIAVLFTMLPYTDIALIFLYLIIGFSLTFFIQVSYVNSCFDRFLNSRIEGAVVGRGMRDPAFDEDDDEDGE